MGIPEMRRRGYPDDIATGSICAGGTLGILIPPSITFILYGIATETSIGRLFLAGVLPGIMLTILGKANEPGALGDVISVLNVQSKHTVQATVVGPGRVSVNAPSARVAANTTP